MVEKCLHGKEVFKILMAAIIVLSVISSPISLSSISSVADTPDQNNKRSSQDSDNDGVPDSTDLLPNGNAVVILSVDYYENTDSWENTDPFFLLGIDGNGDGEITQEDQELWVDDDFLFMDLPVGYYIEPGWGNGPMWHGVDVCDDLTMIDWVVNGYDWDGSFSGADSIDINSNSDYLGVGGTWIPTSPEDIGHYESNGYYDDGILGDGFPDGRINISLRIIKGTTIESVDPQSEREIEDEPSSWIELDEGNEFLFQVTQVYTPDCVDSWPVGYEWYYATYDKSSKTFGELHCIQKYFEEDYNKDNSSNESDFEEIEKPNEFKLFANYGSAGTYVFICIAFSDLIDDFNLYWWDMEGWFVEIRHVNTVPKAEIDITPEDDIKQLDQVSLSAWRSFDVDGDALTYLWELNGEVLGNERDIQHVFYNAGVYNITLTVEDDESATDTALKQITINNYDTSTSSLSKEKIKNGKTIEMDTDYENKAVYRKSASTKFDLIWGMGLEASVSFVSETIIEHEGSAIYRFDDSAGSLEASLVSTKDKFGVNPL